MSKKLLSISVCMLTLFNVSCSNSEKSAEQQTINYQITDEPVTLDPQIANDSCSRLVITNIFEGLVRLDKNGNVTYGTAKEWDNNIEETHYTFYLRENACWNDGSPLTAFDFVYGFQRTFQPETYSPTAYTLYCIKNSEKIRSGKLDVSALGVKALDEHTLEIELDYSNPEFLKLLSSPPAMPCKQSFFEQTGGQYGREDSKILSNGAFYVSENSWEHGKFISLRRNSRYIGQDSPVALGVDIKIAESPENSVDAILNGETDCYAVSGNDIVRAAENRLNLSSFGNTVWGIAFNTKDDVLKIPEIRCALLRSLDRNDILREIPNSCKTVSDIIPETAKLDGIPYRSFVGGIGIKQDKNAKINLQNTVRKNQLDEMPKLNILCTDEPSTQCVVNNIMESWNKLIGSYVNKTPVSREELNERILSGEYSVVIAPLSAEGESPLNTLELFESGSPYNVAQLSDKSYDKLIGQIRLSPDISGIDKMIKAEKFLSEKGIFYPLYSESRYYASAENVKDIVFHPYGAEADFFYASKIEN